MQNITKQSRTRTIPKHNILSSLRLWYHSRRPRSKIGQSHCKPPIIASCCIYQWRFLAARWLDWTLWGCLGLKRLAQKQVIKEPRIPEYVWGLSLPASLTDGCSAESSEGFACASVRRSPTVSDSDLLLWDALGLKSKRPSIKVSDRQFAFDYSICRRSTIVSQWIYTLWPRSQRALQSVSSPVGRSTTSRSGIICTHTYIYIYTLRIIIVFKTAHIDKLLIYRLYSLFISFLQYWKWQLLSNNGLRVSLLAPSHQKQNSTLALAFFALACCFASCAGLRFPLIVHWFQPFVVHILVSKLSG